MVIRIISFFVDVWDYNCFVFFILFVVILCNECLLFFKKKDKILEKVFSYLEFKVLDFVYFKSNLLRIKYYFWDVVRVMNELIIFVFLEFTFE